MKTKINTEKIIITTTYYTDQPELKTKPITRVETEILVDDELYYSNNMSGKLYYSTPTKLTDFLNWLFCVEPKNANRACNASSENSQDSKEELKKILAPIIREVLDQESKKIMKNSTLHKQQKDAEAVHNHFARFNRNFLSLKGDWSLGRRNQSGVLKKHR